MISVLPNDPDELPDYTNFIHCVGLKVEWFEVKIQRIRFETDPLMRPRIFRYGLLTSIDFHGVLSAGVRVLDIGALDDNDLAIP